MTNLEVQTLTELIQRSHRMVYGLASQGRRREDAYRQNLDLLSQAVAQGSAYLSAAQREIGGSPARMGERPPRGVEVATWREFVRQFTSARSTWFNETGAGVASTASLQGEGSMSYRQLAVGEVRDLNAALTARIHAVTSQARVSQTAPAYTNAVQRLREGLAVADARINNYRQEGRGRRLTDAELIALPPDNVPANMWRGGAGLLGIRTAAQQTLTAAMSGSLSAAAPSRGGAQQPAARTAQQPAAQATPTKEGPAAGAEASPSKTTAGSSRQRRTGGGGGGGRRASGGVTDMTIAEAAGAAAEGAQEFASGAFDTARGTFEAIRTVGQILTTTPGELLQGSSLTAPLRLADRLQAIVTVLNPSSVAIYQRPWFWPTLLGVGGYLGYSYYKSSQEKKPATAATKKKAVESAATLPAVAGGTR